jgi:UDP-glucose 4-epimerase
VPYAQVYHADFEDMRRRVPDTSSIQQLIGWKPEHTLDETLRDIVADYLGKNVLHDGVKLDG